ncbi:hypothetical protein BT69DRAFT_1275985 [Atractiella rhizophila]|nr:hypothetical protein BT69DRAFT_1275985 [Atractiella rhizophila]
MLPRLCAKKQGNCVAEGYMAQDGVREGRNHISPSAREQSQNIATVFADQDVETKNPLQEATGANGARMKH